MSLWIFHSFLNRSIDIMMKRCYNGNLASSQFNLVRGHTHTHTHTHIYLIIYIVCGCVKMESASISTHTYILNQYIKTIGRYVLMIMFA